MDGPLSMALNFDLKTKGLKFMQWYTAGENRFAPHPSASLACSDAVALVMPPKASSLRPPLLASGPPPPPPPMPKLFLGHELELLY